jgi:hypothetical protein
MKDWYEITTSRCVITQKSEILFYCLAKVLRLMVASLTILTTLDVEHATVLLYKDYKCWQPV